MQKRVLLLILLCASLALAAENLESDYEPSDTRLIPEYHDFPLDNIHILRLQDAARQLGGNVSILKHDLAEYEAQRAQEIKELKSGMGVMESRMIAQMQGMQAAIDQIAREVQEPELPAPPQPPALNVPAATEDEPPYMMILLGVNIFLLLLVIVLIFWLREQYQKQSKGHKKDNHYHPVPDELTNYVHEEMKKRSIHDIRVELASEGWTPSIIEHAVQSAKERR